jgi:agmatinase
MFIKNPLMDVVAQADSLHLRVLAFSTTLPATPLEISLLELFNEATDLEALCKKNPRARMARPFFERCIHERILLSVDERGRPKLPDTTDVDTATFVHAPRARFGGVHSGEQTHSASVREHADLTFAFVGIPWDRDVSGRAGARFGPSAVRAASGAWVQSLDPLSRRPRGFVDHAACSPDDATPVILAGAAFVDAGDVLAFPGDAADVVRARITRTIASITADDVIPVVVGGDHSITRPVLAGVIDTMRAHSVEDEICIVHFDAHTDMGDAQEDEHGRLVLHHGNVMSVILQECRQVTSIVQIGLRGLIKESQHHGDDRVTAFGIDHVSDVQAIVDAIPDDALCWFSVDIDVVDPAFAPSTGTPVPGGMLPRELISLVAAIAKQRVCLGIDVVEVGEPIGPADGTAGIAATCLMRFCHAMVEAAHLAGEDDDADPPIDDG